ncbi:MAG: GNAT family acetyltransferase [Chromatiales bacterium]|jgi:ribosomal protein S18 acetylase RimI-like enzyme|nr:GNAT family acetyltransferase [Chromatiales bacterium]
MNIRTFESPDSEELKALWQTVLPDDTPHNQPDRVLAEKLAVDDMIYVACENNRLIGTVMAGYDGHRGWLYSVGVLPEHRRAGLGRKLIRHAVDALAALGCRKINLQVRMDNQAVTAFYESLGFSVEERVSMGLRLPP